MQEWVDTFLLHCSILVHFKYDFKSSAFEVREVLEVKETWECRWCYKRDYLMSTLLPEVAIVDHVLFKHS